jgi:Methyltransferase domain
MNTPVFTQDWSWHVRNLWPTHILPKINPNQVIHWLEVGSFEGRSALWITENILLNPQSTITCVDPWEPWDYHEGKRNFDYEATFDNNTSKNKQIIKCKGKSRDILPFLPMNSFHGAYLDGSHETKDVLDDVYMTLPLLLPGAILAFDDYLWQNNDSVKTAVDAFLMKTGRRLNILHHGYQLICQLTTCDKFCLVNPPISPWSKLPHASSEQITPFKPPHHCSRSENQHQETDFHYKIENITAQDPSKHHVLILQTAPRPASTLQQTINSLAIAGSERWIGPKILASDGYMPPVPPGWLHMSTPAPASGSAKAFLKILRHSMTVDPNLEFLTYLQDDVLFCRNSLDYMARIKLPENASLLTWFTYPYDYSYHPSGSPALPGLTPLPAIGLRPTRFFILGQAFTLPRESIESLLYCHYVAHEWPKLNGMDEMPAWAFGDSPYATHFPSLAQHIGGINSACLLTVKNRNPNIDMPPVEERTSPYFPGIDFDALALLKTH